MATSEEKGSQRVEAFSDGVFGVAITLLALDLKPDRAETSRSSMELLHSLAGAWPAYLAFVLSFATVLIMWVNHHAIFRFVQRVNTGLLFANGLLLMLTTLVPVATAVLARQLVGGASQAAAGVYAGLFVLINLSYNLLWACIGRQRSAGRDGPMWRRMGRSYMIGFAGYVLALLLALWSAFATIAICGALWGFWAISARPLHEE